ncbi:hypothetical protein Bhyg_11238 [Pseudolycoriella hygida]|uniref:Uncharacterized protein n=1 Tax=Pseudolycoriella hygida TaxID=35572 RepID=A0A9Q0MXN3_9DIPT|nr:hypothetical protein Bhyg_11238 [Pseudolycoriella hygida]
MDFFILCYTTILNCSAMGCPAPSTLNTTQYNERCESNNLMCNAPEIPIAQPKQDVHALRGTNIGASTNVLCPGGAQHDAAVFTYDRICTLYTATSTRVLQTLMRVEQIEIVRSEFMKHQKLHCMAHIANKVFQAKDHKAIGIKITLKYPQTTQWKV